MSRLLELASLPVVVAFVGCQAGPSAKAPAAASTTQAGASSSAPPVPHCAAPGARSAEGEPIGCLEPAIIQRVVRGNFARLRACYEEGLGRTRSLQGRIAIKFTIERDGTVREARDAGSELPDKTVVDCVVDGFRPMRFPAPADGIVLVVYPIVFAPSD
jgi:hypothetical protein